MQKRTIDANCHASIQIKAAIEDIFTVLSDHEGTPNWVEDVKSVKLLKEGSPKNGVPAIREVNFKPMFWATVQEEIIYYVKDEGYQYKILKMAGVADHLGTWSLTQEEYGNVKVSWDIHFKFKKIHWFRLIIPIFIPAFKKVQEKALLSLKNLLEKSS